MTAVLSQLHIGKFGSIKGQWLSTKKGDRNLQKNMKWSTLQAALIGATVKRLWIKSLHNQKTKKLIHGAELLLKNVYSASSLLMLPLHTSYAGLLTITI